jgi:hypothetical protein
MGLVAAIVHLLVPCRADEGFTPDRAAQAGGRRKLGGSGIQPALRS